MNLSEVDIDDRECVVAAEIGQKPVRGFTEKQPVGKVGQLVEMGKFLDEAALAFLFRDVGMGCDPASIRQRAVRDLDGALIAGCCGRYLASDRIEKNLRAIGVNVDGGGSGTLAQLDQFTQRAARFDHVARQAVHFEITVVA